MPSKVKSDKLLIATLIGNLYVINRNLSLIRHFISLSRRAYMRACCLITKMLFVISIQVFSKIS